MNLLTPAVVKEASREISTGEHVQLDWALENVQFGGFGRQEFDHKLIDLNASLGFKAFDDEIHFNTQIGSQWDSLKHVSIEKVVGRSKGQLTEEQFGSQRTGMYYNGLSHEEATKSSTNGLHSERSARTACGVN